MDSDFSILPDGVYDDGALVLGLGVTHAALVQARRDGELRYTKKGRRVLYLGRWIIAWLEGSNATSEATACKSNQSAERKAPDGRVE